MINQELEYFELNEPWTFEEVFNGSMIMSFLFSSLGIFFCRLSLEPYDILINNTKI